MKRQFDDLQLGSIELFCLAAELSSFTAAAVAAGVTPAAVSRSVSRLEERLGVRLFVRTTRQIRLTDEGKTYFEETRQALAQLVDAERQISGQHATPAGLLRISLPTPYAHYRVLPVLPEFRERFPEVDIDVHISNRNVDFADDTYDLSVRGRAPDDSTLIARKLEDAEMVVVATPAYLAQHPSFAGGESLDGVVLLHDAAPWGGAPEFVEWRTWLEAVRPAWTAHLDGPQFNFSSLAITAALNHQGVAMGRAALVHDEIASGRLVDVFGRHVRAPARYMLLSRNPDDPRTTVFSDWLKAECARFDAARSRLLSNGSRHG